MTVASTTRKAGPFLCDGINAQFFFAFKVFAASDIVVTQTNLSSVDSTLVLTTNYTVSLNADQNANPGGSITCTSVPTSGFYITLTSDVPETQGLTLTNSGGFYPAVLNDALDRVTILVQQEDEQLGRALVLPVSVSGVSTQLPRPVAGQYLAWDGSGLSVINAAGPASGATVSSPMVPVVGAASLTAALTLLGGASIINVANSTYQWLTGMTGTVNAIVGTPASQPAAYTAGQVFRFPSIGANTSSTITLKVGTLPAQNVVRLDGTALASGDIPANGTVEVMHDGTQFRLPDVAPGIRQTATVATTSGTSIDFTGIPSWATRITIAFASVSTSGAGNLLWQLGTGGVPATTGYNWSEGRITNTPSNGWIGSSSGNGFAMWFAAAARNNSGVLTLILVGANQWAASWTEWNDALAGTGNTGYGAGNVTLGGALNMVRLTTTAGDTFDAGNVRLFYE